jgi:hypothetical protein
MVVANYTMLKILVDNDSSADVLYLPAFEHMKLKREQLRSMVSPLVGFTRVYPIGSISSASDCHVDLLDGRL